MILAWWSTSDQPDREPVVFGAMMWLEMHDDMQVTRVLMGPRPEEHADAGISSSADCSWRISA